MKIEKVNDNQIRCTLTREDLAERQIKLSELAYGTEKAKMLFRDMMQQAAYEFGFEADDIPLMIEAIPLSADTIILVITKVEYPEELDTPVKVLVDITKLFMFQNLTELSKLAAVLGGFYKGKNDLYEDVATHRYYLLVSKSRQTPEEFNKVCNILSEYGASRRIFTCDGGIFWANITDW